MSNRMPLKAHRRGAESRIDTTDPLSLCGFANGDGPATSTPTQRANRSSSHVCVRLGRDAPASVKLAAVLVG